jgi:endogenous inhibitor of DNA gyrase (YacG/DUF329 family)
MPTVKCPTCSRPVAWGPDSPYRPFCSERCKKIDLGAWAAEKFTIPGTPLEADSLNGDTPEKHDPYKLQ